jgi:hypothetical protein
MPLTGLGRSASVSAETLASDDDVELVRLSPWLFGLLMAVAQGFFRMPSFQT